MGTEATLIYNLWIFSWLINLIRRLMGIVFGFGGRVLYMALETYHGQVTPQLPALVLHSVSASCMGTLHASVLAFATRYVLPRATE